MSTGTAARPDRPPFKARDEERPRQVEVRAPVTSSTDHSPAYPEEAEGRAEVDYLTKTVGVSEKVRARFEGESGVKR